MRHELANTISQSKKDSQSSIKKKDEGIKQLKTDIENASLKTSKDFTSL